MTVSIPLPVAVEITGILRTFRADKNLVGCLEEAIRIAQTTGSQLDDQAMEIYGHYPRKAARPAALRAIKTAIKKVGFEPLLEHVQNYAATHKHLRIELQYTPMPATWFNQERWADEQVVSVPKDSKFRMGELRRWIRSSPAFRDGPYFVTCATPIQKSALQEWKDELLRLNPDEDFDCLRA